MEHFEDPWQGIKRMARLIWRHCLTLAMIGFLVSIFIKSPLNWENVFYTLCVCVFCDWAKQFIKVTPNSSRYRHSHEDIYSASRNSLHNQWWNPHVRGTPASLMRDHHDR